jgi:2-C-methyl-D-erythritol 4-phosphate cytidylyltransferase
MFQNTRIGALILMAGKGSRLGGAIPKAFVRLGGKPIYQWTLEAFQRSCLFDEILLVHPPDWPVPGGIPGGQTRRESSWLGLQALKKKVDIVVIHDGVRPFVSPSILLQNVEGAIRWGAVDTCIPSTDTIVVAGTDGTLTIPRRENMLRGQTPQSFRYDWIVDAHERIGDETTDDCKLILAAGYPLHVVPGDEENLKITTDLDLFLAEQILRLKGAHPKASRCLAGEKIVVVGGTGAIGQEVARLLREENACPIAIGRLELDLRDLGAIAPFFERLGPIDALVNMAGFLKKGPLSALSAADLTDMMRVNLTGLIEACRVAQVRRAIVNVASSAYSRGRKELSIYSAAKAAVVNFTQSLAEERPDLQINVVVPGRTKSPLRVTNFPNEDPHSLSTPAEVARYIVSTLKDRSLSGAIVPVPFQT